MCSLTNVQKFKKVISKRSDVSYNHAGIGHLQIPQDISPQKKQTVNAIMSHYKNEPNVMKFPQDVSDKNGENGTYSSSQ